MRKYEKRRSGGYKDDALTIGSLVHSGLENWAKSRKLFIEPAVVEELCPSPEALELVSLILNEYVRRYPDEEFKIERAEEPLTFPLVGTDTVGLALIDNHFYNDRLREIESGIPGETIALQPGWWIREYKTKDAQKDRAAYARGWVNNMQASFQMLALERKVGEPVQGLFVCVMEKPRMHIPKRKCKGCSETLELRTFLSTGDGHACILCGYVQQLKPYTPKVEKKAETYRLRVERNPIELAAAKLEITAIAKAMDQMRAGSRSDFAPNRDNCTPYNYECEYFNTHRQDGGLPLEDDKDMIARDTTRYVRLEQLLNAA